MNTEARREAELDPRHEQKRWLLRKVGPGLLFGGAVFLIIGFVDFARAIGSFDHQPRLFWCFFVALPMLWLGFVLSGAGFAGAMQRFMAGESAPVAKDTFNYLAEGTKDGVKTLATAVGQGLSSGGGQATVFQVRCHKCNAHNESDSKFCKSCGTSLAKTEA